MSETENLIASSRTFEAVLLEKDEREKKRAWRMAATGFALAALTITALIILLPLKTTDIELWSVDKQTGRYEYMTRLKEKDIATEAALAHALSAQYVRLGCAKAITIFRFSAIMTTCSSSTATA
ncbi:hypothetical protein OS11_37030 [Dickeya oryzae]